MKRSTYLFVMLCAAGIALSGCKNNAPADVTGTVSVTENAAAEIITAEKAEQIAFTDSGITEADVTHLKVRQEKDDGMNVFEVEFFDAASEYEYEINAETGDILSKSMEPRDVTVLPDGKETSAATVSETETHPLDTTTFQPAVTESTTTSAQAAAVNSTNTAVQKITEDAAKKAAFDNAGIKESDVEYISVKQDRDDGRDIYDVEFYANGTEYDYEIDAYSGKVLSVDKELENLKVLNQTQADSSSTKITEAAAKKAAFDNAGIKESDVEYINVKQDRDDGRDIYDVEFYANGTEYDYEIDAYSGKVLSVDKELENLKVPKKTETKSAGGKITEAEANKIAFDDAGVSEADVKRLKTEFDRDDGREVYEIEFYYNNMEYSYEINAADGSIIEKDIDRD